MKKNLAPSSELSAVDPSNSGVQELAREGLVACAAKDIVASSTAGVVPSLARQSPTLANNQQLLLPLQLLPLQLLPPQQLAVTPQQLAVTPPQLAVTPQQLAVTPQQLAVTPPQQAVTLPQLAVTPPQLAVPPPQMVLRDISELNNPSQIHN